MIQVIETYEVRVNGEEIGGGFGGATKGSAVIFGQQIVTLG